MQHLRSTSPWSKSNFKAMRNKTHYTAPYRRFEAVQWLDRPEARRGFLYVQLQQTAHSPVRTWDGQAPKYLIHWQMEVAGTPPRTFGLDQPSKRQPARAVCSPLRQALFDRLLSLCLPAVLLSNHR